MTITQHTERLSRAEADIVVRHLAGEYHNQHGMENRDPLFDEFTAKLAWQIGGENNRSFRASVLEVLEAYEGLMDIYWGDQPHDRRHQYESDLNVAVNEALSAAGVEGSWVNRSGEQREVTMLKAAA